MRFLLPGLACVSVLVVFACGGDDPSGGPTSGTDGGADGSIDGPANPNEDGGATDPECTDGVKGPTEADVDCGGKCAPCVDGKKCAVDTECASGACEKGTCWPTAVCYASGFCYENPKPSGGWWHSVWGSAPNDVWIAGELGKAVRWNGKHFLVYETGLDFIFQVAGADATHVWAIDGAGGIAFFDGTKWSPQASGTTAQLRSLSVSSAQNAWAVGYNGTILKYDGLSWSTVVPNVPFTNGLTVYTTSPTDVWAGGDNTIIHWNGATWATETTGAANAETIFGAGGSVWAARGGNVWKRDASMWTQQADGLPGQSIAHGWALDATHAYAVAYGAIYELAGTTWAPMNDATRSYRSIFGFAANDLWAVGASGEIERFDGAGWKDQRTYTNVGTLAAVAGTSLTNVTAVGPVGLVLRRKGSSWVKEDVTDPNEGTASDQFNGVWTSGPTNTVIVGYNGKIYRHDGTGWKREGLPNDFEPSWYSISGSSPSSLWIVGEEGASGRYDGTQWTAVSTGVTAHLRGVWNADATNTWAVGLNGTILHHDGAGWKTETSPTPYDLHAVWAFDSGNVFAGSQNNESNLLVRKNGTWGFAPKPADGSYEVRALAGHSPADVWLAGGSTLSHYDGTNVVRFPAAGVSIVAMAAVGSSTFAVGQNGYVLHRQ